MTVRAPYAKFPGVEHVVGCTYTMSHGISPGVATLRVLPQELTTTYSFVGATGFQEFGDLIITDDVETVLLRDCRVVKVHMDDSYKQEWTIELQDRRWRWIETGSISGEYNQLDSHGKLIPWTIKSPWELVVLCLQEMGELNGTYILGQQIPNFVIDMPPGLSSEDGKNWLSQGIPPWYGVTPTTGTNPPINWNAVRPAIALQELCDHFGRHIVPTWKNNGIMIVRPGIGANLPDGSICEVTPEFTKPLVPAGITISGAPTGYQFRMYLEPVGEEWDGSFRPINHLSYAPVVNPAEQVVDVVLTTPNLESVNGTAFTVTINGVVFVVVGTGVDTASTIMSALSAQIAASTHVNIQNKVSSSSTAAPDGTWAVLTLTGSTPGYAFTVSIADAAAAAGVDFNMVDVQAPAVGGVDWSLSNPFSFSDVIATDRLTYEQARQLALKTVWRTYRVADGDYFNLPHFVPGYGKLVRRQQIVLLPEQVEQIQPGAADANIIEAHSGQPLIVNHYNGYSRNKKAAVYGSVAQHKWFYGFYNGVREDMHNEPNTQVFVDFTIDSERQLVIFQEPVFRTGAFNAVAQQPLYIRPDIWLQTGCHILNPITNAPERFTMSRSLEPTSDDALPVIVADSKYKTEIREDVQLNIIGYYEADAPHVLTDTKFLEEDPFFRAKYYLDGMQAQFFSAGALTLKYNGIRAMDLDGAIQQITWDIGYGLSPASTVASRNSEHSLYIPPYPARRRVEFQMSLQQQRLAEQTAIENRLSARVRRS